MLCARRLEPPAKRRLQRGQHAKTFGGCARMVDGAIGESQEKKPEARSANQELPSAGDFNV